METEYYRPWAVPVSAHVLPQNTYPRAFAGRQAARVLYGVADRDLEADARPANKATSGQRGRAVLVPLAALQRCGVWMRLGVSHIPAGGIRMIQCNGRSLYRTGWRCRGFRSRRLSDLISAMRPANKRPPTRKRARRAQFCRSQRGTLPCRKYIPPRWYSCWRDA
jgi:hypothetical protein